ncbi:MAG TPA: 3-phosphoshikimate 1-carboxyvinyltransferase [Planctomycetaceae bacterium]|nr:3-phosphoshikimate 1-carboxyvinyltransferase [Planctomycetaceae bacterium]HCK52571.1 3-phosphoshikimate 1-carboxyvinyltransferase [Planctomycetaceae bacterium]
MVSPPLPIQPVTGPISGSIRPPGSKSLTNRALVLAALARGTTRLTGMLDSVDTRVMLESLATLGFETSAGQAIGETHIVGGDGTIPATSATLNLENSGTSIRFLTALTSLAHGKFTLDGNPRMRQRPIADLVTALRELGVDASCPEETGCPPVTVVASGLGGGQARISGNSSSQYLSALLMTAPCAAEPVTISIDGTLVSRPYIDMTLALMSRFGAAVTEDPAGTFSIPTTGYDAITLDIEPDATAASYFLAAAAVTGGQVTVEGLGREALQGDVAFADCLAQMGCSVRETPGGLQVEGGELVGIDVDMNAISDTAQTLAIVAAFAEGPTRIRGIAHARIKETDRISATVTELARLGLHVEEHDDGLTVHPGPMVPAEIQTYDDHRMAMSFAVAGLVSPGVVIIDPDCTTKTYPGFFEDLARLCGVSR